MKLTKTVLAVAIAGIAATPMMASATTSLSGVVQIKFTGNDDGAECNLDDTDLVADGRGVVDADGEEVAACVANTNGQIHDASDAKIAAGDVQVGISASQALNSGLTGYGSLRVDLDNVSGNAITGDSVWVGVKGGFGDIRLGEVGNPGEYGQLTDIAFDAGTGINEGISYTGSFGGASVGVAYSPAPNHDLFAVGAKFGWKGLSVGVGMQNDDELTNTTASIGFAYAGAAIGVGAQLFEAGEGGDDETVIQATVGYSIAGVSLGLNFQSADVAETTAFQVNAGYDLGGGMGVDARIDSKDADGDATSAWRVQLTKSF